MNSEVAKRFPSSCQELRMASLPGENLGNELFQVPRLKNSENMWSIVESRWGVERYVTLLDYVGAFQKWK